MISGLMQNPSMIGAYMNDPRMQLVSRCHQQHPVQLASSQAAAPGIVSLCLFCLCLTALTHSGSGVCCVCSGAGVPYR